MSLLHDIPPLLISHCSVSVASRPSISCVLHYSTTYKAVRYDNLWQSCCVVASCAIMLLHPCSEHALHHLLISLWWPHCMMGVDPHIRHGYPTRLAQRVPCPSFNAMQHTAAMCSFRTHGCSPGVRCGGSMHTSLHVHWCCVAVVHKHQLCVGLWAGPQLLRDWRKLRIW